MKISKINLNRQKVAAEGQRLSFKSRCDKRVFNSLSSEGAKDETRIKKNTLRKHSIFQTLSKPKLQ